MFRSTDDGKTWTQINNGLEPYIKYLEVNSSDHLFAIAAGDFYHSEDNGDHWEPMSKPGGDGRTVEAFVISPNGNFFVVDVSKKVFRSMDNGNSWVYVSDLSTRKRVGAIVVTPAGHLIIASGDEYLRRCFLNQLIPIVHHCLSSDIHLCRSN